MLRGKAILKYAGSLFLAFIIAIGLYMLAAFICSRMKVKAERGTTNDVSIFILTNGVHADIIVPVKTDQLDWSKQIRFEHTLKKDSMVQYVAFGWGDKEFYIETPTWADLKCKTAFNAILGLNTAAIHTTFYNSLMEGKNCKKINLSKEQYVRLINYIDKSFLKNEIGSYIHLGEEVNYGAYDAFYEAKGRYNLFYTSNTWTNNALKACGQKACLWTPFDWGIFYQYPD